MRTPILFKSVFTSASASKMRRWLFFIVISATGLSLLPASRAVDPPPDGGYPNDNTAEGESALFYLTSGVGNAAVGFRALFLDQTGQYNTAIGAGALYNNTTASNNTAVGFEALESNSGSENTAVGSRSKLHHRQQQHSHRCRGTGEGRRREYHPHRQIDSGCHLHRRYFRQNRGQRQRGSSVC
jgi:hypothetical protein